MPLARLNVFAAVSGKLLKQIDIGASIMDERSVNWARRHRFGSFAYIMSNAKVEQLPPMNEKRETVLAVHGNADGYWYIGAGRSIAEGPYRNPEQLLSVASDLLAAEPHWRIDVFDVAGNKIISYSSEQLSAVDLDALRRQHPWNALASSSASSSSH